MTENEWLDKATAAAIAAAKKVVDGGSVNSRVAVGRLSTAEWGWIVSGAIFGWIETKAKQAVTEGCSSEITIRANCGQPAAWDAGAVGTILSALADVPGLDWDKPIGAWSKEQITSLAWHAHRLVDAALAARHEGQKDVITRLQEEEARLINAAAGNPLLAPGELPSDDIPF